MPRFRPHSRATVGLVGAALVTLAASLAACADSAPGAITAPAAAPSKEVVSPAVTAYGMLRDVPLAKDVVYSFVAQNGGSGAGVVIPGTGLRVDVPNNALPKGVRSMTITVTARAGRLVAYDFEPHGTAFNAPITLTQSTKGTNYDRLANKAAVETGYYAQPAQLDTVTNTALVNEFLPVSADVTGINLKTQVTHFSGYMMSSGRK